MIITKRVQTQLNRFLTLIQKNKYDGFLVTHYLDQFYLLDFMFNEAEAVLLVSKGRCVCFTRTLYVQPLRAMSKMIDVIGEDGDRLSRAVAYAKAKGLRKIGFDVQRESYLSGKFLVQNGCKEAPGFLTQMRRQKDETELKSLRASNRLAYQTYAYIRPRIKTGMTEVQVAAEMEQFMRKRGAVSPSFPTIVAFGENAANPHHVSGMRKLKKEDCVLIDFGCVYQGYCSDMTRSWWHGKKVPTEYQKIWKIVDSARKAGIQAVKPGVTGQQVDDVSRTIISQAGYGKFFTHATGHGVGIEIHEAPYNSQQCQDKLVEGNVVTVEPGIYLPEKYGVRLEDTVAVSRKGSVILTRK